MPIESIILICISAITHAAWNLICKSKSPSAAFFLLASTASVTAMTPIYIYFSPVIAQLPPLVWIIIIISSLVQAGYYISLGNAYRLTEISIAYPMARSIPVLLVPMVTAVFSFGLSLTVLSVIGMLLISSGCLILPLRTFNNFKLRTYLTKGLPFIISAALATTAYTVIDSQGLKIMDSAGLTTKPFHVAMIYIAMQNVFIVLCLIPYVMLHITERATIKDLVRRHLKFPIISGITCTFGYCLVLIAMMLASNVSYIAAFRQLSIPLGAVLGIIIFNENVSRPKTLGLILIFSGLVLVAIF